MFNGVEHRAFNLTFNIAPLSKKESEQFLLIKEILQYHQMPANEGYLLKVPDEFKIRYMHLETEAVEGYGRKPIYHSVENKYYPQSMGCYLQSISYIPNEQGDAIHLDGAPVTSQLTLQFSEIEVLDKGRLTHGNHYYKTNKTEGVSGNDKDK